MSFLRWRLLGWAVVAVLLAGGSFYVAREQVRIISLYGDAPQTITVADLAENGYGRNIWVDLIQGEPGTVLVEQTRNGKLSTAWCPLFPRGQRDKAKTIEVIVRMTRPDDLENTTAIFEPREHYRGSVINATLLAPYTPYRPLLAEKYPNHKLADTIWEVELNSEKPSGKWANIFYGASGGFLLLAVLLIGAMFLVKR